LLELYEAVRSNLVGRKEEIKAILAALQAGKHILLEGPPGTSKSTILRSIARAAGRPIYIIEGNIDLTPAKLIGHFNPSLVLKDDYRPEYFVKGPLVRAMEEGGFLYLEEFNRMPADVCNVLISPMEEGELHVPRYGTVRAVSPFAVIAAQNPYDDVGTVRVSRAFMDRVCRVKMDYQSEEEELEIVRLRTGCEDEFLIGLAVRLVRATRTHPDVKLGASVRAAIDIVAISLNLLKLGFEFSTAFSQAALMAVSGRIWLNELVSKTAEEVVGEILDRFPARARSTSAGDREKEDKRPYSPGELQKKTEYSSGRSSGAGSKILSTTAS
jgi:MoxR-like ATPase